MKRRLWDAALAIVLVAGSAWIWVSRLPANTAPDGALPPAPAINHPAPSFSLETLDGSTFTLDGEQAVPVILNFWATWCPPCQAELPELESASRRLQGQVYVVGVNQGETRDAVQAYVKETGLTLTIPLDDQGQVSRAYAVRSLPTTFFIDREGKIAAIRRGPLTEATLAASLRAIYP